MRRLVSLLQLAYKAGSLNFGYDNLKRLKGNYFILAAEDLSERTKRDILSKYNFKTYFLFSKEKLGSIFGKNSIGIVIIKRDNLGIEIERTLEQTLKEAKCLGTSQ